MSKIFRTEEGNKWEYGEQLPGDWHTYKGPCPHCGARTFNYGGGWRCMALYCNNNASNPAPSVGKEPDWWHEPINVFKEGNSWCATYEDFINLQESNAGFGNSPQEAVDNLRAA